VSLIFVFEPSQPGGEIRRVVNFLGFCIRECMVYVYFYDRFSCPGERTYLTAINE
jgi:hypothetical protein